MIGHLIQKVVPIKSNNHRIAEHNKNATKKNLPLGRFFKLSEEIFICFMIRFWLQYPFLKHPLF